MTGSARSVSAQVEKAALASLELHPLQREAAGWAYRASDVFEESKAFVDRLRIGAADKDRIQAALESVGTVLVVSYWTAERKPEPMCGGGKHYAFFLHPHTFAVLHSGVGAWRS